MAGYKQSQLKNKSFAEIQKLFNKAMTRVNIFVDKDTGFVKESSKNAKVEMAQESSSKRTGEELKQEVAKKQKINDDQEEAEMKKLINIVPDEEKVAIDAIPLATKPPSIKLVKAKHGSTRPEEGYERVLWGNLRTMFQDMHLFMLVEKRYPLTPATITEMLNKKLQTDHLNEMCYQLLKLMTKQLKKQ
ncbi:hypothetical protein Tco_1064967 [Tanacetum coccineum]